MRKKEKRWITIGLIVLFAAIAWWAYHGGGGGFLDLSDSLNNNTNSTTYQLAVADLSAVVDQQTGHVTVSFSLTNEEHFNISSVQVLYALNVADPNNATYTALNATAENGTYKAEILASFGDVVYYKIKVTYTGGELVTDVQSITVSDTTAPTATLSVDYNATTGNATITVNASDNDAIDRVVLFYAVTSDGNLTNVTFSNVTLSVSPYTHVVAVPANNYLDVYAEVYDISGNMARVPANGTIQLYANETKSVSG